MINVSRYEKKLRSRLRELSRRISAVQSELDQPPDADSEERASEREGDEVLEGLGSAGLAEIRMIQAALERIANGTFGTCVACGDDIAEERLEAVPHASRCRRCA